MDFSFFEISGDPLSAQLLVVGAQGQARPVKETAAKLFLSAPADDQGDFFLSSWTDDPVLTQDVERYHATVQGRGGAQVSFAYLTATGDGIDDNVNRIVVLDGALSCGDVLRNIAPEQTRVTPPPEEPAVICFTPGTQIATPTGPKPIETLGLDDLVITADNGLQPIRWTGTKPITGARMQAYPELRPIRIRKGALGDGLPERDMWVSPQHRMLIRAPASGPVFDEPEVLVPARGLLNDRSVTVDYGLPKTRYIHLMFDRHEVIFANGSPTESFAPSAQAIAGLDPVSRDGFWASFPDLEHSPDTAKPLARKSLCLSETRALAEIALV